MYEANNDKSLQEILSDASDLIYDKVGYNKPLMTATLF